MAVTEPPEISANGFEDYTCITFSPDLKRFNMIQMDSDIVALMTKRAYDLAGITDKKVMIHINGTLIGVNNFDQYCDMYLKINENKDLPKIIETKHDRW